MSTNKAAGRAWRPGFSRQLVTIWNGSSPPAYLDGFTLVEMLVTLALSGLVLSIIMTLFVFGLRSFAGLGNYASLSGQSRLSLDFMSRQMREATQLLAANTNLPVRSLTLTNSLIGSTIVYRWDSATGMLTTDVTGQPTRTNLTGCDDWQFSFYQRTPANDWTFFPTDDLALCKLINMSWKCSKTVLGQKLNTEDMMTAQVVLRNKL